MLSTALMLLGLLTAHHACLSSAASLSHDSKKDAIGDVIARNKRDVGGFSGAKRLVETDRAKRDVGGFSGAKWLVETDRAKRHAQFNITKRDVGDFSGVIWLAERIESLRNLLEGDKQHAY